MSEEIKQWDIWFADFPYDENDGRSADRPVIVLNVKPLLILSVKVTTHGVRSNDPYDIEIKYWKEANLARPSVARISKTIELSPKSFRKRVGALHPQDAIAVRNTYWQFVCDSKKMVDEDQTDINSDDNQDDNNTSEDTENTEHEPDTSAALPNYEQESEEDKESSLDPEAATIEFF